MARTKSHYKKQEQKNARREKEQERRENPKPVQTKAHEMSKKERFQHDASKIVQMSQFLQEQAGAGWARVPVDGGKEYIGLLFDADHWTIIEGELYYHPSGTFSGDDMVFESIEPMKQRPPKKPNPTSVVPQFSSFLNPYGYLQVVPNVPRTRTSKHP